MKIVLKTKTNELFQEKKNKIKKIKLDIQFVTILCFFIDYLIPLVDKVLVELKVVYCDTWKIVAIL